jgi:Fe-S-cluster-containing dehydrogenase component
VVKCTLCVDRIADGLEPACAKTCPTDAIMWGELDGMMKYANDRIAWLKATQGDRFASAQIKLYPAADFACHVRWILLDTREKHGLNGDM